MTLLYLIGHKYSNVTTEPVMTVYSICLSKTRCFFFFFCFVLFVSAIRRPQDRWERLFAGAPFTIKKGTSSLLFLTIKFNFSMRQIIVLIQFSVVNIKSKKIWKEPAQVKWCHECRSFSNCPPYLLACPCRGLVTKPWH